MFGQMSLEIEDWYTVKMHSMHANMQENMLQSTEACHVNSLKLIKVSIRFEHDCSSVNYIP